MWGQGRRSSLSSPLPGSFPWPFSSLRGGLDCPPSDNRYDNQRIGGRLANGREIKAAIYLAGVGDNRRIMHNIPGETREIAVPNVRIAGIAVKYRDRKRT